MKTVLVSLCLLVGVFGIASNGFGQSPVEYVKICDVFGPGFQYVPGTDICHNTTTGDARQLTDAGVWRSYLPYPEGNWVKNLRRECKGKLVKVGTFSSTDFTLNAWDRKETPPFDLQLGPDEFISKVMMSGGFYDPRLTNRSGVNGPLGLCLRSKDPSVFIPGQDGPENPPFGNSLLPIGCVANSRILNMPAAYSITATAAYPSIITVFTGADQSTVSGPQVYGKQLVVTTDIGAGGPSLLTYFDVPAQLTKPMAGSLSVTVCVGESFMGIN